MTYQISHVLHTQEVLEEGIILKRYYVCRKICILPSPILVLINLPASIEVTFQARSSK